MLLKDYPLGFKLDLHHKDLCNALNQAKELKLKLPVTSLVKEIEAHLIKEGYGSKDISVLREYIQIDH